MGREHRIWSILCFSRCTMLNMTSLFVASILSICKGFKLFFPPHWVIPWVVRLLIQSQGPLELHHRAIWLQGGSGQAPERHQPLWRPWNWSMDWIKHTIPSPIDVQWWIYTKTSNLEPKKLLLELLHRAIWWFMTPERLWPLWRP